MSYESVDFSSLLGLPGFSDELLQTHFKLYDGYVANTNKALELLDSLETGSPEWAEVRRRFGWEFNGMRLHELYFGNLASDGGEPDGDLAQQLEKDFGSVLDWEADFRAAGAMRGIGWVVLAFDPHAKRLFNVWVNEHDVGHLAGAVPLLVMDVFEHAFVQDFGMDRKAYMDAFFGAIHWHEVARRFKNE